MLPKQCARAFLSTAFASPIKAKVSSPSRTSEAVERPTRSAETHCEAEQFARPPPHSLYPCPSWPLSHTGNIDAKVHRWSEATVTRFARPASNETKVPTQTVLGASGCRTHQLIAPYLYSRYLKPRGADLRNPLQSLHTFNRFPCPLPSSSGMITRRPILIAPHRVN